MSAPNLTGAQRRKLGSYFTRDNPRKVVSLTGAAPEWLRGAIYAAHCGALPDDWVYETAQDVCLAIDDGAIAIDLDSDGADDSIHEWADSAVDIYSASIRQWYADHAGSDWYGTAEDEAGDLLGDETNIVRRLQVTQYCAIRQIANTIIEAYRAARDEEGEADE